MITVCNKDMCNGCMACVEKCRMHAITVNTGSKAYNALIDSSQCISCKACFSVCPRNQKELPLIKPQKWYQGWASEDIRGESSSGGVASAIMLAFIKKGGYVCSCLFENGEFKFELSNSVEIVKKFAGSKYVKSNPIGIYSRIQSALKSGKKVLFLGLPCQVAGVKNYIDAKYQENLYTIDLICHGTPDQGILNKYLADHDIDIKKTTNISFRRKNDFRVWCEYKTIVAPKLLDSYLYTFLQRVNYTENCYSCQFAKIDRISDLTLGDSWGSTLNDEEQKKGISILLCQTERGEELVGNAGLTLFDVDQGIAIEKNEQLHTAARKPKSREKFFELFNRGVKYDKIAFELFPKTFVRQKIKKFLIRVHVI